MNKLWKINLSDIRDSMTFSRRIIVRGEVNNQEIIWTEKKEEKNYCVWLTEKST